MGFSVWFKPVLTGWVKLGWVLPVQPCQGLTRFLLRPQKSAYLFANNSNICITLLTLFNSLYITFICFDISWWLKKLRWTGKVVQRNISESLTSKSLGRPAARKIDHRKICGNQPVDEGSKVAVAGPGVAMKCKTVKIPHSLHSSLLYLQK